MEKVSRNKAKKLGLLYYFTGKACVRGHFERRYVSTRICAACQKENGVMPKYRKMSREITDKLIRRALNIYGCKCQVCGESDPIVLQWHHRSGDNRKNRHDMKKICREVVQANEILPLYMLLCANCHCRQDHIDKTNIKGTRMVRLIA